MCERFAVIESYSKCKQFLEGGSFMNVLSSRDIYKQEAEPRSRTGSKKLLCCVPHHKGVLCCYFYFEIKSSLEFTHLPVLDRLNKKP